MTIGTAHRERDANLRSLAVVLVVVLGVCAFYFGESMYSVENLKSMGFQIPEFGFVALAMMLSFMIGGIDLSIISSAVVAGIVASYILTGQWGELPEGLRIVVAVPAAIAVSTGLGYFNGKLITKFGVPSLIATLGTMTLYSGIGMALTGGKSIVGFPADFTAAGTATLGAIPIIFIGVAVVATALSLVLSLTVAGRKLYLCGGNPVASRFSGINNESVVLLVFVLIGVLAGLAGLTIISRVNSVKVGYGEAYILQALIVCVVGGIHPAGGKGSVLGVVLAVVLMQVLASAFTIMQLSPYTTKLIWGLVLIVVMGMTRESVRVTALIRDYLNTKTNKGAKNEI